MRLSGLAIALLLLSCLAFAQHHDTPSAPPPAPPSPVHSASPAPAPTPSPSPSVSPSPAATPSHSSAPSPSTPSISSESRTVHPVTSAPNSVTAGSTAAKPEAMPNSEISSERVVPVEKLSGESRIAGSARIREVPPDKEPNAKPAQPDLRHHICLSGPCEAQAAKPTPPESDLRRHICITGPCSCPSGQTFTKNGCVGTVNNVVPDACQPGQFWNGAVCEPSPTQCAPGLYWNGAVCVSSAAECATLNARADSMIAELNALRARVEQACRATPSSDDCAAAKLERDGAIQRYRMLLTEGPSRCALSLPDASLFSTEFP